MIQDGEDMAADIKDPAWASLSYAEKNRELFERQKRLLGMFLERNPLYGGESDADGKDEPFGCRG